MRSILYTIFVTVYLAEGYASFVIEQVEKIGLRGALRTLKRLVWQRFMATHLMIHDGL